MENRESLFVALLRMQSLANQELTENINWFFGRTQLGNTFKTKLRNTFKTKLGNTFKTTSCLKTNDFLRLPDRRLIKKN